MTDDLDTLRPEVAHSVRCVDAEPFSDGAIMHWPVVRAELLRLQSTESRANEWQLRAERAEAELAALKARIDALMLEFCPDDMTDEQSAAWAARQKPVED